MYLQFNSIHRTYKVYWKHREKFINNKQRNVKKNPQTDTLVLSPQCRQPTKDRELNLGGEARLKSRGLKSWHLAL